MSTVDPAPIRNSTYTGGLDGLRGFAAIIVVMVHARVAWLQGGVSIISTFFPLSGFLITRNLLREIDGSNRVDFRRFWTRRVRRLLPASVIGVALATSAQVIRGAPPRVIEWASALTGWKNWQMIASPSYSDAALSVWWSLAIEEQYYLVYPSLLLVLVLWGGRRGTTIAFWIIAVSSFLTVLYGYHDGRGFEVYHGTHGRLWELLAGCLLAMAGKLPDRLRLSPVWSFGAIAVCQTSLLIRDDIWFMPVARTLVTILGTVWLIDGVVNGPATRTTRLLGSWPLRPLGLVSYEIYMVHTSVLMLLPRLGGVRAVTVTGAFLLSVAVACLVHVAVTPFRSK